MLNRERLEGGIEVLRIDRPKQRNAFDSALLAEMNGALAALAEDDSLRVLVLSSTSPDALSGGADVAEQLDPAAGVARMEAFAEMYARMSAFPTPTIAVCVGHCLGAGAEIVAACDLRVAGDNLKARWVGSLHGVPVGPARLVPLLGEALARDLVFTSRVLGAEEALRCGFARSVHPAAEAEAAALELAASLAERPPEGMRRMKRLFLDLGGGESRVEHENDQLVDFQRHGSGLPRRG